MNEAPVKEMVYVWAVIGPAYTPFLFMAVRGVCDGFPDYSDDCVKMTDRL